MREVRNASTGPLELSDHRWHVVPGSVIHVEGSPDPVWSAGS